MVAERRIHVGLNLSPTEDLRVAALPLLEASEVDVLELSVDMAFVPLPEWADALLEFFGYEGRLVGHGVEMSLFTAGQDERRARWLANLDQVLARYRMSHLSEHFGFMTGGDFTGGTPMPLPFTRASFDVGKRHLQELKAHLKGAPVGLENLALALSPRDVDEQPDFLAALLEEVDGFLHLDLHNLYCQAENYDRNPSALLRRYPLDRVLKIHMAGGNYFTSESAPGRPFRRDDHEREVPADCFALLEEALALCPKLETIVFEHADHALHTQEQLDAFRASYRRVRAMVADAPPQAEAPEVGERGGPAASEADIAPLQAALLESLDQTRDEEEARARLASDARLEPFRAWVESFDPRALSLARVLVDRWGERTLLAPEGEMRAAVLEGPRLLRYRTLALPVPAAGQVRMRILASGVCGTDVHFFRGRYALPTPLVLGHEAVGVVEEVGPGVKAPRVGDRVGVPWAQQSCGRCPECLANKPRFCRALTSWVTNGGFFAEQARVQAAACVQVPDTLDPILAAPLFCAGHTAFAALEAVDAKAKDRVAILGVGGIGHLAIQLAAQRGCEVFALTTDPTKAEQAARLGAHHVVVGRHGAEALARAGGVDAILSTTSDPAAAGPLVAALRPEGRLAVAGLGDAPLCIDAAALVQRGASVVPVIPGGPSQLAKVVALAAEGRVTPVVERYGLAQLRRALYRLADSRVRYRAVCTLD